MKFVVSETPNLSTRRKAYCQHWLRHRSWLKAQWCYFILDRAAKLKDRPIGIAQPSRNS
ncbi:hypothetical protein QT976_01525 [Microcoleus sp. w2-18aC6]